MKNISLFQETNEVQPEALALQTQEVGGPPHQETLVSVVEAPTGQQGSNAAAESTIVRESLIEQPAGEESEPECTAPPAPEPAPVEEAPGLAPNGMAFSRGQISIDSNGRGGERQAGTLGLSIGGDLDARHLASLEKGTHVAVFVHVPQFKLVGVLVGRASRKSTIYIRREALEAIGFREHSPVFYSIANVNGKPPRNRLEAEMEEALSEKGDVDSFVQKAIAIAKDRKGLSQLAEAVMAEMQQDISSTTMIPPGVGTVEGAATPS